MKKQSYILINLLIFFILMLATCGAFFLLEFTSPPSVKTQSYLEINLSGGMQEKVSPDLLSTMMGVKPDISLHDVWMSIRNARSDRHIQALVVNLGLLQCNWAKISELRDIILDFKSSGKKTYVFMEEALEFDKEYYLATAFDEIILHPQGYLGINGIGGFTPFFKHSLKMLGIEAEVEHVAEYKTAYHMFTEDKFTPAHREMMTSIYDSIFSHYIRTIAEARVRSEAEMADFIDRGLFQGPEAREAGLVDGLLYRDELEDRLQTDNGRLSRVSLSQYLRTRPSPEEFSRGEKIALIYETGTILSAENSRGIMGSHTIARWIKQARKDDSIRALVLRVDSPGGSVVAADTIWREVILAKKEKPVVVTMSDVAGSGGYQISMAAHEIIAQPQTLTGSIGVIFAKFNLEKLYSKLGVTTERMTFGQRADMLSPYRSATPDEKKMLRDSILWTYDQFLEKVAAGRNITKETADGLGKGRVWTGLQAKENGLVDEIGGLALAVERAKNLAGIPDEDDVRLVVWPKRVSFWESFRARRIPQTRLFPDTDMQKALETYRMLEKQQIWALMPTWIIHKNSQ